MTTTALQKRTSTATTIAIGLMLVVAVVVATRRLPARAPEPPPGYERLAEADLAAQAYDAHPLALFSLAQEGEVGLYYTLENVRATAFELAIVGADGTRYPVMSAEGLRTDRRGDGAWATTLPAGEYNLLLTADPGEGTLTVFASMP